MSSRQRFSICYTMPEAIAPWLRYTAGVERAMTAGGVQR